MKTFYKVAARAAYLLISLAFIAVVFTALPFAAKLPEVRVCWADVESVEIGSAVQLSAMVQSVQGGTLTNGDEWLNTTALGTVSYIISVLDEGGQVQRFTGTVLVKDETPPQLFAPDTLFAVQNTAMDLTENVAVTDNSGELLTVQVIGDYDLSQCGDYALQFVATDSSGNRAECPFVLTVTAPKSSAAGTTAAAVTTAADYEITVYREYCTTVVRARDAQGNYTVVVKVFVCSPGQGNNTTLGTFSIGNRYRWATLIGPCYGQYALRFNGSILFHSVPYKSTKPDSLEYWLYNRLGSKDSLGCVRLTVADAKWMYENCAAGTRVIVTADALPPGITKPSAVKIPTEDARRGWDPTDPDVNNPWLNVDITALQSSESTSVREAGSSVAPSLSEPADSPSEVVSEPIEPSQSEGEVSSAAEFVSHAQSGTSSAESAESIESISESASTSESASESVNQTSSQVD